MKNLKTKILFGTGLLFLIAAFILMLLNMYKPAGNPESSISEDSLPDSVVKFSADSNFRVVCDSLVHVWNVNTGTKTGEFTLNGNDFTFFGKVQDLAIHPDGKKLVILSNENILSAWDIPSGKCLLNNTDYSPTECGTLDFTLNGQFLFLVSFREATVDILRWPDLQYITTGNLGRYRNSFSWENLDGKLVFVFEEGDCLFKIEFPDGSNAGSPEFTMPQMVSETADE